MRLFGRKKTIVPYQQQFTGRVSRSRNKKRKGGRTVLHRGKVARDPAVARNMQMIRARGSLAPANRGATLAAYIKAQNEARGN